MLYKRFCHQVPLDYHFPMMAWMKSRLRVLLFAVSLLISSACLSLGSLQIAHAENCDIYTGYIAQSLGRGDISAAARWQQESSNCNSRNANAIRVGAGVETRLDCSLSYRYFIDALTRGNIERAYGWGQRNAQCESYNRDVGERERLASAQAAAARAARRGMSCRARRRRRPSRRDPFRAAVCMPLLVPQRKKEAKKEAAIHKK
jgi:hypothetical protein